LCAYSVPVFIMRHSTASLAEQHALQLFGSALLHIWQDMRITIHC